VSTSAGLTSAQRLARAERHRHVGLLVAEAGDEWACVPLFYSAYHLVRDALLNDPVFADDRSCRAKHPLLTCTDNQVTRHHGRSHPDKVWGINDLVTLLYRRVVVDYELLHAASIDVRYHDGFKGDLEDVKASLQTIWDAYEQGLLVA
jgi:hypothetical protein